MTAPADSARGTVAVDYDPFAEAPLERVVPATEAQREIWLAARLEPGASLAYNESVTLHLSGTLEVAALRGALQGVLDRHDALRGSFSADGQQFCVAAAATLAFVETDLSAVPETGRAAALEAILREAVETPFDLEHAPLLRTRLLRLDATEHVLLISTHHIVCDGWSFGVIVRELAELYGAALQGREATLPTPPSFAEFALGEAVHPQSADYRADEAYWLQRNSPLPPPLDLPLDHARPRQRGFVSRREDLVLDANLVAALKRAGAARGASLYATLLATFGVLLQRLSGQDDLVVGIPAAGQSAADQPGLVGHAVNVLPLRLALDPAVSFEATLRQVRSDLLDAFEHQRYTFGTLLKRLSIARDPARLPLVSVLFNLDPGLEDESLGFEGLRARFAGVARSFENFEVFINAVQVGGALRLECQYRSDLFDAATITRWLDAYATLLRAVVDDATRALAALPMLSATAAAELHALQPAPTAFEARRIEALFFAQAARTPQHCAIEFGELRLSYSELEQRARRIAAALRARGVVAGDLVGVSVQRGPDMLAAILGVLAAGAGYVPLDPAFPRERLDFMARDAGLALLLTEDALVASVDFAPERVLTVAAAAAMPIAADAATEPAASDTEAIAYVIYTSGSTGTPKGVRVPHRAVANFLASMRREPGLAAGDRLLAVTTLSFDIAVLELFLPLSVGASVVLASREQVMDGRALAELIHAREISVMQATPSAWRMLLEAGWSGRCGFRALCGGEALPPDLAATLLERCDELWNLYGPTETTVWSTCARIASTAQGIGIGRPIDNTRIDILDAHGATCPIGVAGEIVIGGAGVTAGYLDRAELTAERFIADPSATDPQARRYRTGDRGRWRNDGTLEHLGRLDFQVKVRGFRIELGDIETNLARHAAVARAVVIVREDRPGDQRLVAYLVARDNAGIDEADLRTHLRTLLPEYMIPQHFIVLDSIPLLPNGKIDRARLPAPQFAQAESVRAHVAPRDELERRIAAIMEQALSLPGIGVEDDFFALGGHSLLAAQLTAQLGREFSLSLSLGLLFEFPTVAGLAAALRQRLAEPARQATTAMQPLEDPRIAPLSLLQKRLWLFEQLNPGTVVYNTPSAHRLRGNLDESAFERAFTEMTRRQAILRTTIERDGSEVIQRIHDVVPARFFPAEDLSALPAAERERQLMSRLDALTNVVIDLEQAPLYRTHMFRLAADEHVFFFMPHHIIWDGWSFDLFYTEFAELYAAFREGRAPALEPLPASYGEFAQWHAQWLQGPEYAGQFARELAHWKQRLGESGAPPPLPTDRPRGTALVGRGETEWIAVPAALTESLRTLGRRADATLFMSLLAAYYALLWRFVGSGNLVVGTPVRVRASDQVENVMGLFTNLLPLPIDVDPGESFLALVGRVKATVMKGFASPEVQLEDLMREPGMRELAGATHFYQAQFSYQDARERNSRWAGLQQEQVLIFQRAASEDLAIWFLEHGKGMVGGVLYNADLFEADTARLFAAHYLELLDRVVADPAQSIAALTSANRADLARIDDFGRIAPRAEPAPCLDQAFERRADQDPARAVVRIGSWATSAGELELRANRLAACLRTRGIGRGAVVVLAAEHSVNAVAALLAVFKVGATLLPLDPTLPAPSLTAALNEAGAVLLLGESTLVGRLDWPRQQSLCFDADAAEIMAGADARVTADHAAGDHALLLRGPGNAETTRLWAISHAELGALLGECAARLGANEGDGVFGVTAPGAALSVFECLLALVRGLEWIPATGAERDDAGTLRARLEATRPRFVLAAADVWIALAALEAGGAPIGCAICVGDGLDVASVDAARNMAVEVWLAGAVGAAGLPFATLGRAPAADTARAFAGTPLLRTRVLDERGGLAPTASAGRLCVAGPVPLASTAGSEVFAAIADPVDGTEWYPTALRARWLHDGRLGIVAAGTVAGSVLHRPPPPRAPREQAPATEAMSFSERWLAELWKSLLGLPAVEASDNFFDLGGHSLLAMTLVARVEDQTGVRLAILKVANSSLRALAADLPQEAIEAAARRAPSLKERALRLFGMRRETES
ncbi:non-ribosomal peptide synthetase [Dokdonella immobilis]|uniref:Amino acid adenylation domain-containing protein n=1 Tax=Dokdonella immobilis TaxID=578942 RepID=A0A1I4VFH3_9GAMM|nr:non-ribosomal peptide synthetase [Dokdonella immobilis]SFM99925.1 amino acid adenylation domain-containing protein [Dokdonella immobilis]